MPEEIPMYLEHYGLSRKPFDISPDPSFLWRGEKHREGLAILKYGILENKGFLLITGDVGTGKTALIRAIEKEVRGAAVLVTIPDPRLELIDFYNFLAAELDMGRTFTHKADFLIHFKPLLINAFNSKKRVLLIVDESQRLKPDLLEEIRMLSNIDLEGKLLINIFFVGQSEFLQVLAKDENRSIRQRITMSYHLQPLTGDETRDYIQHRLKVAGAPDPVFSADAMQAVFESTRGYPRLINIVCDHAMMTGYARAITAIGRDTIEECAGELRTTIGWEPPAAAVLPAPAPPDLKPHMLPTLKPDSGPRPLRGLVALAGCMALLGGAWLLWGDAFSEAVATWGQRVQAPKPADSAPSPDRVGSGAAPIVAAQPEASAPAPSETGAPPKTSAQSGTPPKTKGGSKSPAGVSAAANGANPAAAPQPGGAAEPAGLPAVERAGAAPLPFAPEQREVIVYFTLTSAEIPIYARVTLAAVARRLEELPQTAAVIEGHTDAIGNPSVNQAISAARAAAVKDFLINQGVAAARLSVAGMGSTMPLEANDTPQGRSRNRRVVVRLTELP
jgi:general secretion pathway protein A